MGAVGAWGVLVTRAEELLEQATPIKGYPGYSITRDGWVLSASNWRGYPVRPLTRTYDLDGYATVRLRHPSGRRVGYRVHKLVADAFLGTRPSSDHQIRHLNGDKSDNRVENLCWGTALENAADRELHGNTARGLRNGAARAALARRVA